MMPAVSTPLHSTTVLLVRRNGAVCLASDGQVTLGNTVLKRGASKVKRAGGGKVLVGFAGGAADGLALFTRFEAKLDEYRGNLERAVVELAKDWRTDRMLRQLEAMMIVATARRAYLVSGTGDLLQPDEDGLLAVGSGGPYALAAARPSSATPSCRRRADRRGGARDPPPGSASTPTTALTIEEA